MSRDIMRVCTSAATVDAPRLARWFPVPSLVAPRAAGVDISDTSIKWIEFVPKGKGLVVHTYGSVQIKPGVVIEGIVRDEVVLAEALKELQKKVGGTPYLHAALPEEAAYVFTVHTPEVRDRAQTRAIIEFEFEARVPLALENAVYDYDVVDMHPDGVGAEIAVVVFARDIVEGYERAFARAGLALQSLEIEARSIARALVPQASEAVTLVVDFGRARSGIAVVSGRVPMFTSTVEVGGDLMTRVIMEKIDVDTVGAEKIKNDQGIVGEDSRVTEAVVNTAAALADEVTRHFQYWDSRHTEHGAKVTPITQVLLVGGSSNLKGLPEYVAERVHARVLRGNPWINCCTFDAYIPPIHRHHALGYATAIGLALRGI